MVVKPKDMLEVIPKDTAEGKNGLISIISVRADAGDADAMKAMDHIQEIATENWDDLPQHLKNTIAKVFESLKKTEKKKR